MIATVEPKWEFVYQRHPSHWLQAITPEGHYAEFPSTKEDLVAMIRKFIDGGRESFSHLLSPRILKSRPGGFTDDFFTTPALAELISPERSGLSLWLAPELSSVEWHYKPGYSNARVILADRPYTEEDREFLWEGHHSGVSCSSLVPTQQVIDIAVYFFEYGTCPDGVRWSDVTLFGQADFKLPERRPVNVVPVNQLDPNEEVPF